MVNIDEIRKEIAIKHNVLVGKDDPILVTIALNEALLKRFAEELSDLSIEHQNKLLLILNNQSENSKLIAEKIINSSASYAANKINDAVSSSIDEAIKKIKEYENNLSARDDKLVKYMNNFLLLSGLNILIFLFFIIIQLL